MSAAASGITSAGGGGGRRGGRGGAGSSNMTPSSLLSASGTSAAASSATSGAGGQQQPPPPIPPPQPTSSATRMSSIRSMASTSSQRSATNMRTINFFKYIVGVRQADYCSDAPPPPPPPPPGGLQEQTTTSSFPSRFGRSMLSLRSITGGGVGAGGEGTRNVPCWKRAMCCCCNKVDRRHLIMTVLNSKPYRILLIVLTFILLFGAPIQTLVIPKAGDDACNAVFMATFVVFIVDICMRIDAEPNYFAFSFCGVPKPRTWDEDDDDANGGGGGGHGDGDGGGASGPTGGSGTVGGGGGGGDGDNSSLRSASAADAGKGRNGCCGIELGSFLFWADLVSALTLLHEISFIDTSGNFDPVQMWIWLDEYGVPELGLDSLNANSPVETEVGLFVIIAKTARVARFIRSSTAIKISSRVNWDYFINLVNPCWYWQYIRRKCLPSITRRDPNAGFNSTNDLLLSSHFVSRRVDEAGTAGGGGDGGSVSNASIRGGAVRSTTMATMLRNNWGGLNVAMIAAVRTEQSKAKKEKGLLAAPGRMLRFVGILPPFETNEMLRQVGAIKIQRAWRRYAKTLDHPLEKRMSDLPGNAAWTGRAQRITTGNPVESILQKRSFLMRYSTMNKKNIFSSATSGSAGMSPATDHQGRAVKRRNESQVGSAMRELTGQRVAIGIILALVLTVLFTYMENDATRPSTMIVLHSQTKYPSFANRSLDAARASSVPDLFYYKLANNETREYDIPEIHGNASTLRKREVYQVTVQSPTSWGVNATTMGLFAYRTERREQAVVSLLSTIFILIVWFAGVTSFAGPVMVLVVIPIERMVRLLSMLMADPLGYENTPRYRRFIEEEDYIVQNTRWTKEVLKGMETSFLMSTILRIGSLMKVGFGSAGVEIIRNHLEKGQNKNMLMLSEKGSSVSCIFLFCDIRQFTDATECLQEQVFVFTNRIAAVVHSYCHAYGGSANKNIGDAFLCSWLLDEDPSTSGYKGVGGFMGGKGEENFVANTNQADKALLSVVKISMALHYDDFYIEPLSNTAREALCSKLSKRKGPVVQMGFGLHAGKAVQGAIGSQRKIDATYVSEHVERAEFLESSTKQYGVKMLMSDSFHRLLHPSNRRRCRKVDQVLIQDEEDAEDDYVDADGKIIELLTFDMDIDALWRNNKGKRGGEGANETDSEKGSEGKPAVRSGSVKGLRSPSMLKGRRSVRNAGGSSPMTMSDEFSERFGEAPNSNHATDHDLRDSGPPKLVLPTGTALYNANVWLSEDMRKVRLLYSDGLFFQKFNSGLQAFYSRDWEHAKQCFVQILDSFEDGPSRYFLNQIEKNKGVPPRDFRGYGIA